MPEVMMDPTGPSEEAQQAEVQKVNEAKAALADEARGEPAPEKILNKYDSVDDLIAAHKALQAEYTRVKQGLPTAQADQPEGAPEGQELPPTDQAPQGEQEQQQPPAQLTPEQAKQIVETIYDIAGGEERFTAVQQWAAQNGKVPDFQKQAFNDALAAGRLPEALTLFKAMQYDYLMDTGWEATPIRGRETSGSIQPFRSQGEALAAMADPRYDSGSAKFDQAYMEEVVARLNQSNVFVPR